MISRDLLDSLEMHREVHPEFHPSEHRKAAVFAWSFIVFTVALVLYGVAVMVGLV